jgi:hypothetical protein
VAELQVAVEQLNAARFAETVKSAGPKFRPVTVMDDAPLTTTLRNEPELIGASKVTMFAAVPATPATVRAVQSNETAIAETRHLTTVAVDQLAVAQLALYNCADAVGE